jgi:hypothetical protein
MDMIVFLLAAVVVTSGFAAGGTIVLMLIPVSLAAMVFYGGIQGLLAIAKVVLPAHIAKVLVPDPPTQEELARRREEADQVAAQRMAQIEADLREAAATAREALRPKTSQEALARITQGRVAVTEAAAELQRAEAAAKEQSGGWVAVCEARDAVARAEDLAAKASADAALFLPASPVANEPPLAVFSPVVCGGGGSNSSMAEASGMAPYSSSVGTAGLFDQRKAARAVVMLPRASALPVCGFGCPTELPRPFLLQRPLRPAQACGGAAAASALRFAMTAALRRRL